MSTAEPTQPFTVRMFLAEGSQGPDIAAVIAESLRERDIARSALEGVRRLSDSALEAVHSEIDKVAVGFLDLELGELLVSGWRKYTELVKAADRTLAAPDSKEVVTLATHQVSSVHHPSIELLVDEVKVYTFVFELTVEFNLVGVVAVVQRGELVALRSGECTVTVTFTLEGAPVLRPRTARVDLPLVVTPNPAIPLLRRTA